MKNKKVAMLFTYIALMIIISVVTFSVDNRLWRYDKYVHFFEFFILAVLIANIFLSKLDFKKVIYLMLLITFLAFLDEGIQIFIPVRSPDWNDLYSDLFGGYLGLLLVYLLKDKING
tara:strand:- start:2120 stop:2470 length:351 start_codon:yes stop_codon:yes gene_type:complete